MKTVYEQFYIIRTDYHGESWLYAMTDTLTDAQQLIQDEKLQNTDTVIECCKGSFPFNYEIYKTISAQKA